MSGQRLGGGSAATRSAMAGTTVETSAETTTGKATTDETTTDETTTDETTTDGTAAGDGVRRGQTNGQVNGHPVAGAARPPHRRDIPKKTSWVLPGAPAAVSRARLVTRETMLAWEAGDDTDVEDVVLIVDELVTNAVVHGCGPVTLVLRVEAGTLVGEVGDHAGALPDFTGHAGEGEWGRESGRGLWLVSMLAADHGVRRETAGKTLWFTRVLTP